MKKQPRRFKTWQIMGASLFIVLAAVLGFAIWQHWPPFDQLVQPAASIFGPVTDPKKFFSDLKVSRAYGDQKEGYDIEYEGAGLSVLENVSNDGMDLWMTLSIEKSGYATLEFSEMTGAEAEVEYCIVDPVKKTVVIYYYNNTLETHDGAYVRAVYVMRGPTQLARRSLELHKGQSYVTNAELMAALNRHYNAMTYFFKHRMNFPTIQAVIKYLKPQAPTIVKKWTAADESSRAKAASEYSASSK